MFGEEYFQCRVSLRSETFGIYTSTVIGAKDATVNMLSKLSCKFYWQESTASSMLLMKFQFIKFNSSSLERTWLLSSGLSVARANYFQNVSPASLLLGVG